MKDIIWSLIIKVFAFIIAGVFLSKTLEERKEKLIGMFVNFAVYFIVPLYVFLSLWAAPVNIVSADKVLILAFLVICAGYVFAVLFARYSKSSVKDVCLPVMFMNSAYLGIPVSTALWGETGAFYTIIYSAVLTLMHFSLGVWLVSHQESVWEIFKLPFLYAAVLGGAFNIFSVPVPDAADSLNVIVSNITLPLMLIFTGFRLGEIQFHMINKAVTAVALRIIGGFAVSVILVYVLKIKDPVMAGVCILISSMPAAVNSYILAEKFNADPELTSASIFLGTIVTLFTIPFIHGFIAYFIK